MYPEQGQVNYRTATGTVPLQASPLDRASADELKR